MFFNQGKIIKIIRDYLINRNRIELAKNLVTGYCYGLSLYFCDRAENNELDSFYGLLSAIAKWDKFEDKKFLQEAEKIQETEPWKSANKKLNVSLSEIQVNPDTTLSDKIHWAKEQGHLTEDEKKLLLSTLLPDDINIEKLLNNMEWLQIKYTLLSKTMSDREKMDFLHESSAASVPHKEFLDFVTSMNFPKVKLPELLAQFPLNRAIQFGNGRHAFSCYRDNEGWQFYDSNNETKTSIRKTPEEFAKDIENVYEKPDGIKDGYIPLGFFIFSNQSEKPWDTSKLQAFCDYYTGSENTHLVTSKNESDYPWDKISPLSLAIIMNAPSDYIIKLIDQGADITLTDSIGFQPLHYAIFSKKTDIVQYLLNKKANIHQPINRNDEKLIPEAQSFYLSLQGATPLHLAVIYNDMEMTSLLLANGADINAKTDMGLTSLAFAAIKGHEEMVEFLINQGADLSTKVNINDEMRSKLSKKTSESITPLEYLGAIDASFLNNENNIAMCAATYNQLNTVLQCLDHGIDINATTNDGITLLHIAVYLNHLELTQALLNRGANPHALCHFDPKDRSKVTNALGVAALTNNLPLVELLLKHKTIEKRETEVVNAVPVPAMVIALEHALDSGNSSIINVLTELDPEQQSLAETKASLNFAATWAYITGKKFLLEKMLSNPYSNDLNRLLKNAINENDFSLIEKLVKEKKVNLDKLDFLDDLFRKPSREAIGAFLLKNGLNILNYVDNYMDFNSYQKGSLLAMSLDERFHETLYPLILDSLKNENKEKINELDESGNSFLHHAVNARNNAVLKDLLEMGANPRVVNKENESVLKYTDNNQEAFELLIKYSKIYSDKEKSASQHLIKSDSNPINQEVALAIISATSKQDKKNEKISINNNLCLFSNITDTKDTSAHENKNTIDPINPSAESAVNNAQNVISTSPF